MTMAVAMAMMVAMAVIMLAVIMLGAAAPYRGCRC